MDDIVPNWISHLEKADWQRADKLGCESEGYIQWILTYAGARELAYDERYTV
jgi:beta-glucosidase/6-phospho-beta-glucosidase/beta-galactosidase